MRSLVGCDQVLLDYGVEAFSVSYRLGEFGMRTGDKSTVICMVYFIF